MNKRQLKIASEMRIRIRRLRGLNVPDKTIEKLIKSMNLPLGLSLNLLNTK